MHRPERELLAADGVGWLAASDESMEAEPGEAGRWNGTTECALNMSLTYCGSSSSSSESDASPTANTKPQSYKLHSELSYRVDTLTVAAYEILGESRPH